MADRTLIAAAVAARRKLPMRPIRASWSAPPCADERPESMPAAMSRMPPIRKAVAPKPPPSPPWSLAAAAHRRGGRWSGAARRCDAVRRLPPEAPRIRRRTCQSTSAARRACAAPSRFDELLPFSFGPEQSRAMTRSGARPSLRAAGRTSTPRSAIMLGSSLGAVAADVEIGTVDPLWQSAGLSGSRGLRPCRQPGRSARSAAQPVAVLRGRARIL